MHHSDLPANAETGTHALKNSAAEILLQTAAAALQTEALQKIKVLTCVLYLR